MIRLSALIFASLCLPPLTLLQGQQEQALHNLANESDMGSEAMEVIHRRWIASQPAAIVLTKDGKQYSGQPVHAGIDTLYLSASGGFPVGPDCYNNLHRIPFHEVDKVLIQKGGNLVTRSRKAESFNIPVENKYFTPGYQALRKAVVYPDSLLIPNTLEEAFPHSPVLRRVFPHKHLRISFSAGFGGDAVLNDARKALLSSTLPNPEDGYDNVAGIDFLDVSWRFGDRVILGAQLAARINSSTLYAYGQAPDFSNGYQYDVYYHEHRVYAEYAFFHVDRFFTKRWEFLVGTGLLMGRPEWTLFYNYDEYSDPDNPVYGTETHRQADPLWGFQLRTSFHYYIFPGLSLWTGLEGNIYGPWSIHQVEVPSNNPSVSLVLQEHTLNFSSVRFKLGVSIYL